MFNIYFFIAGFASISWIIYGYKKLGIYVAFTSQNVELAYQSILVLLIPIALLWWIFVTIKNIHTEKRTAYYLYGINEQIKKQETSLNNLEQVLSLISTDIKNNRILQEFNLLVSDINEILSDIIKRSNSISSAQLEHLWTRTSGGEHWIITKTFIEISSYQTDFSEHLQEKAKKDNLLKGSILEFDARYKAFHSLLKNNDQQKIFYEMIEYGSLGKVFDILTPIAQALTNNGKTFSKPKINEQQPKVTPSFTLSEEPLSFPSFLSKTDTSVNNTERQNTTINKIQPVKESQQKLENADFSADTPIISSFTQTQMALRNIKQSEKIEEKRTERKTPTISLDELEKEINASPENNYDEYAYPFGAWLDGKKNK